MNAAALPSVGANEEIIDKRDGFFLCVLSGGQSKMREKYLRSALYVATDRPELQTAQGDASGLRRAHVQGRNDVDCQAAYPCSSS